MKEFKEFFKGKEDDFIQNNKANHFEILTYNKDISPSDYDRK